MFVDLVISNGGQVTGPGAAHHDTFVVETKPQFGAGSLFRITGLGIQGVPEPRFGG